MRRMAMLMRSASKLIEVDEPITFTLGNSKLLFLLVYVVILNSFYRQERLIVSCYACGNALGCRTTIPRMTPAQHLAKHCLLSSAHLFCIYAMQMRACRVQPVGSLPVQPTRLASLPSRPLRSFVAPLSARLPALQKPVLQHMRPLVSVSAAATAEAPPQEETFQYQAEVHTC